MWSDAIFDQLCGIAPSHFIRGPVYVLCMTVCPGVYDRWIHWVATVNWMWNSRTFPGLPRNILGKLKSLLYQKHFVILFINSAMSFTCTTTAWTGLLLGKIEPLFVFSYIKICYIKGIMSGCNNQLILIIFAVKDEKFCSFMIFKDSNPNSRTFQGLEFSFANSTGTYFQGPWQPCIQLLFLVTIPVLWLVSSNNPNSKVAFLH